MAAKLWKTAVACVLSCGAGGHALAQNAPHDMAGMHGTMSGDMAAMHAQTQQQAGQPTLPGQDAFGAIQEIVRILDADPKTDWSTVNLEALRQHLIDMNEVTLKADAAPRRIEGGLDIAVTGTGRTLVAIQRMLPEWAKMANGHSGWTAKATALPNGERLTVTATTPKEVDHIRGLGFIGLLASGSWHQPHHLAMARGTFGDPHDAH
jgi:hypothetical protein